MTSRRNVRVRDSVNGAGENRRLTGRPAPHVESRTLRFIERRSPGQRLHLHFLREPVHHAGATPTTVNRRRSRGERARRKKGLARYIALYCTSGRANGNARLPDVAAASVARCSFRFCKYVYREYICFAKPV